MGEPLINPAESQMRALQQLQHLYPFEEKDKTQEQLFNKISKELRCTVCQNQSLFDSNAPIALDLRQEVYRQIRDGHSESEIIEFAVERYGDAILYSPPLHANTTLLWFGPVLMLIFAGCLLIKYLKLSNDPLNNNNGNSNHNNNSNNSNTCNSNDRSDQNLCQ